MNKKLIYILVDGLSADYVKKNPQNVPNMLALAKDGLLVERLKSPVPASSMPGRASMLTGFDTAEHGIYGNHLLEGKAFMPADPSDVRRPTIAHLAAAAGLDVACTGAALIHRDDASIWMPPAWMRGFLDNSRFRKEIPPERFSLTRLVQDPDGRIAKEGIKSPYSHFPGAAIARETPREHTAVVEDQLMMMTATALACSDTPPDVIFIDIDMPDSAQHDYGYESEMGHFSITHSDQLIGSLLNNLHNAGRDDMYNFAIASDHGHGEIRTAIFIDAVLPDNLWQCEGAMLHVVIESETERADVTSRLKEVGAEPWDSSHIPQDQRENIATFVAPDYCGFEVLGPNAEKKEPVGPARTISTHGLRPGNPADDRFCVFSGPNVQKGIISSAEHQQFATTLAAILGLKTKSPAEPLI